MFNYTPHQDVFTLPTITHDNPVGAKNGICKSNNTGENHGKIAVRVNIFFLIERSSSSYSDNQIKSRFIVEQHIYSTLNTNSNSTAYSTAT